jgi:hypothetical protein
LKVTIDSTEPLADALRVIGALYNVTLSASTNHTGANNQPQTAPSPRRGAAAANRKRTQPATENKPTRRRPERATSKRTSAQASSVSTSEIRSWAKANGHAVNSRGTLPASIRSAYADVHSR